MRKRKAEPEPEWNEAPSVLAVTVMDGAVGNRVRYDPTSGVFNFPAPEDRWWGEMAAKLQALAERETLRVTVEESEACLPHLAAETVA